MMRSLLDLLVIAALVAACGAPMASMAWVRLRDLRRRRGAAR